MTPKGSNPPLYELMRGGRRKAEAAPKPPGRESQPSSTWSWLSPGRTIRLPVGYLLLGTAAALVLLVAAFTVGYARGHRFAKARFEQQDWSATAQPLMRVPPPEEIAAVPDPGAATVAAGPVAVEPAMPQGWGPAVSDPRVAGRNYFVLIHTQYDNAVELADFCRGNGLEAYVIQADNMALYRVIVLPGYDKGQRASDLVHRLERDIVEVATKWRLQVNPRDDLAYYPERYDP